jgi:hypothetical protein
MKNDIFWDVTALSFAITELSDANIAPNHKGEEVRQLETNLTVTRRC